jgi:DNA-binding GntR family transcriptional regulator
VTTVLTPGSRISEAELAARLDMSKTPVREALRRLESEGLVEPIPRVGYLVAKISYREVREAFEARAAIEGYAARLAAEQIDDAHLSQLVAGYEEALAALSGETGHDLEIMRSFNASLHKAIVDSADNALLSQMLDSIRIKVTRPIDRFIGNDVTRFRRSLEEHKQILDALASHDADRSEEAVRNHIDSVAQHILTRFR